MSLHQPQCVSLQQPTVKEQSEAWLYNWHGCNEGALCSPSLATLNLVTMSASHVQDAQVTMVDVSVHVCWESERVKFPKPWENLYRSRGKHTNSIRTGTRSHDRTMVSDIERQQHYHCATPHIEMHGSPECT